MEKMEKNVLHEEDIGNLGAACGNRSGGAVGGRSCGSRDDVPLQLTRPRGELVWESSELDGGQLHERRNTCFGSFSPLCNNENINLQSPQKKSSKRNDAAMSNGTDKHRSRVTLSSTAVSNAACYASDVEGRKQDESASIDGLSGLLSDDTSSSYQENSDNELDRLRDAGEDDTPSNTVYKFEDTINICQGKVCDDHFCCCPAVLTKKLQSPQEAELSSSTTSSSSTSEVVPPSVAVVEESSCVVLADSLESAAPLLEPSSSSEEAIVIGETTFFLYKPTCDDSCNCLQCRSAVISLKSLPHPVLGSVVESYPDWTYDVQVPYDDPDGEIIGRMPWQCLRFESNLNDSNFKWGMTGLTVAILSEVASSDDTSTADDHDVECWIEPIESEELLEPSKEPTGSNSNSMNARIDARYSCPSPLKGVRSTKRHESSEIPPNFEEEEQNNRKRKRECVAMDAMVEGIAMKSDAMVEDDDARDHAMMEAMVLHTEHDLRTKRPHLIPDVLQVYIGNLNDSVTSDDILVLTSQFDIGSVLVSLPKKRRDYAFVTILESDLNRALLMDGTKFKDQKLKVNKAHKQRIPSLTLMRPHCSCRFSVEGRCIVDASEPFDDPNPFCPFGMHCYENDVLGQSSNVLRDEEKERIERERSIALQRMKAADPKLVDEQNANCRELLERTPLGVYHAQPLVLPLSTEVRQEEKRVREEQERRELDEQLKLCIASLLDMEYLCEVGSESAARKGAKKLTKNMQEYFTKKKKSPFNEEGQAAWDLVKKQFPDCATALRQVLIDDERYCKSVLDQIFFKSRPMTRKDGSEPGVYLLILFLDQLIKIGMSNKGMFGRVDQQLPGGVSPDQCSAICVTRAETVELMKNSPCLDSFIKECCNALPAYQYDSDHNELAYAKIATQFMESSLMTILARSEGRKVEIGLGLEGLLNIGSGFINENCQFPYLNAGDNAWIVGFQSRSVSFSSIGTWITVPSELYDMTDACNDDWTIWGMRDILREPPRGSFVTNFMYEVLVEADNNTLWDGFHNAITTNPVIGFVSGKIDEMKIVLRDDALDVNGEHRSQNRRRIGEIVQTFDSATDYKYDFQEPDKKELAKKTAFLMRQRIKEVQATLQEGSNSTAIIYIEKIAIEAIENQPWGPNALNKLMSSESNEMKAVGHHGQVASFRIVPNTCGRICFVIIDSFCPILGQSSDANEDGRRYLAQTRIRGVFNYVTLLGLNKMSRVISSQHAEQVRRRCLSLLIAWEGMKGNFGKKQEIDTSNLNMGIIQFLPKGYNRGRYVQNGTVALGNLFSTSGVNEYLTALMLLRLGMPSFAQAVNLVSGENINQENLRESMDELREKQRKMDLQKRTVETRKRISEGNKGKRTGQKDSAETRKRKSEGNKGKKRSVEQRIASVLGNQISRVKKAREECVKYEIHEYECKYCKEELKRDYKQIYNVFGVEVFNKGKGKGTYSYLVATCPCCQKHARHLQKSKQFKLLRKVSLSYLEKRFAKLKHLSSNY